MLEGDLGQFMTPTALSNSVSKFLGASETRGENRAEPACGIGALVMADLRQIYAMQGKDGISRVDYSINDLDQRLVRIATVQIMFHSIRHEAQLKRLVAHNADAIRDYNSSPPFFVATSWRAVLPGQLV
ncbi:N-6 DNA methylase [Ensifer sp. B1-9]|uniref:N-6 DNA methylase n=1 Tax=Ensifer sp. B1-9 TaxID=3141455 RepID=UPI003D1AB120